MPGLSFAAFVRAGNRFVAASKLSGGGERDGTVVFAQHKRPSGFVVLSNVRIGAVASEAATARATREDIVIDDAPESTLPDGGAP